MSPHSPRELNPTREQINGSVEVGAADRQQQIAKKKKKTGEKHKRDKLKSTKNKHDLRTGTLEQGQGFALCVGLLSYLHLRAPGPVSVFQVLNQSKLPENSRTALGGNGQASPVLGERSLARMFVYFFVAAMERKRSAAVIRSGDMNGS